MSAECLLTSSALAGRAAPPTTTQRAAARRGGLHLFNGTIRRPLAASAAPLSPLQPHEQCRASIGRAPTATREGLVARASVEGLDEDRASASPPSSCFTVKSFFDPTAGLSSAQLAALATAALEADAAGGSRRQIKVAALAKRTGLDRSEVLQWLRAVEELLPSSSSSGEGDGKSGGAAAARARRESTLGAYAAAGAAAAARAKAASAARQEERQRRREAADAKKSSSGGKKEEGAEGGEDDDGTWSTKKGLGRRGGARLSKAAEATLDRVYANDPFPSDEVVAGVRELHRELPKRVVLDHFAERRREDARGKKDRKGNSSAAAAPGAAAAAAAASAPAPARD